MRHLGFHKFRDYYQHVQGDRTGEALVELIDALTTNHTSFFREPAHFDFLVGRVFPEHISAQHHISAQPQRTRPHAHLERGQFDRRGALLHRAYGERTHGKGQRRGQPPPLLHILATDISTRALETARKGMYKSDRFPEGLAPWLRKHLLRGEGRWQGWYRMRPEILKMVEFHRLNLIEPLPDVGRFTVIFCRNVMIYFSRETQALVVNHLAACLEPGGYLFVGHAESLTGIEHPLESVQPAVYRMRGGPK
jgi:chemotaxis protein methyltransferase CheR